SSVARSSPHHPGTMRRIGRTIQSVSTARNAESWLRAPVRNHCSRKRSSNASANSSPSVVIRKISARINMSLLAEFVAKFVRAFVRDFDCANDRFFHPIGGHAVECGFGGAAFRGHAFSQRGEGIGTFSRQF